MQYTIEIVEQVTMTVHVDAESEESALQQVDRQFAMREVETIDWQTLSTRVLDQMLDEQRPFPTNQIELVES